MLSHYSYILGGFIIMNMEDPIFQNFCRQRKLSTGSIKIYNNALTKYCEFTKMTLKELLYEADTDEREGKQWKERRLKDKLIEFKVWLIEQGYVDSTVQDYVKKVKGFYRHHYIEIHSISEKAKGKKFNPITFTQLPNTQILKSAIDISPLIKALILFLSSSGLSKVDALKLTIEDWLTATSQYTNNEKDIYKAINILRERDDVVPTISMRRTKTKKFFTTFCSPEATLAISNYLDSRTDQLKPESKLFKRSNSWFDERFHELNEKLGLGETDNGYIILRCHNLRKFHSTSLKNDGLSIDFVNALQGKSKTSVDEVYFLDDPETLKQEYIKHLNCLTVNMDVHNVEFKSPEYMELERENIELKDNYNKMWEEINSMKARQDAWETLKKGD